MNSLSQRAHSCRVAPSAATAATAGRAATSPTPARRAATPASTSTTIGCRWCSQQRPTAARHQYGRTQLFHKLTRSACLCRSHTGAAGPPDAPAVRGRLHREGLHPGKIYTAYCLALPSRLRRCLCLVFPPPSRLRRCLCLLFPPPSRLRRCLCLVFPPPSRLKTLPVPCV